MAFNLGTAVDGRLVHGICVHARFHDLDLGHSGSAKVTNQR